MPMPALAGLPNELVCMIATTGILEVPDLAHFIRTCRRFHAIGEPLLYAADHQFYTPEAVCWAAIHGRNGTLDKCLLHGLKVKPARRKPMRHAATLHPHQPLSGDRHPCLYSPVLYAVYMGHRDTVAWFLDHGTTVNTKFDASCCRHALLPRVRVSLLHVARCLGHDSIVQLMLARGAENDDDEAAAKKDNEEPPTKKTMPKLEGQDISLEFVLGALRRGACIKDVLDIVREAADAEHHDTRITHAESQMACMWALRRRSLF